jgi:hypothetical protein
MGRAGLRHRNRHRDRGAVDDVRQGDDWDWVVVWLVIFALLFMLMVVLD